MVITNKLNEVCNQLRNLLIQCNDINVSALNLLPEQIDKLSIGVNKIPLCIDKTIQTITQSDLNGVTSIGKYAFYYCDSLTSITIGDSVTSIGDRAFYYCDSLTSVTIGDSVTSIGEYAFYYCDSLTSITIGDSVTSIGEGAFYYCESLTSVTIGDSVTSIGDRAFYGCIRLTDIYVNRTTPPTITSTSIPQTTPTIHVPIGSGATYKSATNWSNYADRIVEDIVIE